MSRTLAAAKYLAERDPKLGAMMDGRKPFQVTAGTDVFVALLESIVSQQLSVQAADTIFDRFLDLFPGRTPSARLLSRMTDEHLRTAGVSRQKAGYLRNVAAFAGRGALRREDLQALDDEAAIRHLTQIKGVGRWTAEMLLMFSLDRPDVLPVDDLGIRMAMKKLYRLRSDGPRLTARMKQIAEPWRPHRTLACKYLWRWRGEEG